MSRTRFRLINHRFHCHDWPTQARLITLGHFTNRTQYTNQKNLKTALISSSPAPHQYPPTKKIKTTPSKQQQQQTKQHQESVNWSKVQDPARILELKQTRHVKKNTQRKESSDWEREITCETRVSEVRFRVREKRRRKSMDIFARKSSFAVMQFFFPFFGVFSGLLGWCLDGRIDRLCPCSFSIVSKSASTTLC